MTVTKNAENFRQYKIRFSLIVEQILIFASSSNMVTDVEKSFSKLQTNCVTMFHVIKYPHLDS